jgi:SAM-dependent methyltransferase
MHGDDTQPGKSDREARILAFHNSLLDRRSDDDLFWTVAGWSSLATQQSRFDQLLKASSFRGGSVLDWGCGAGDLHGRLAQTGHEFEYHGLDVNPRMIKLAENRFGPRFEQVPLGYRLDGQYDYIYASGLFQFVDDSCPLYYLDQLQNMFCCARRAVAVNFLSALRDGDNKVDDELYIDPSVLIPNLAAICDRWVVDHSYHPGKADFTVALIKAEVPYAWKRPSFG